VGRTFASNSTRWRSAKSAAAHPHTGSRNPRARFEFQRELVAVGRDGGRLHHAVPKDQRLRTFGIEFTPWPQPVCPLDQNPGTDKSEQVADRGQNACYAATGKST
jgi:hypothetical protein